MSDNSYTYKCYNREERNLCAHLFRFLLEGLAEDLEQGRLEKSGLCKFLDVIEDDNGRKLKFDRNVKTVGIYCEVALIRDAYHIRIHTESDKNDLIDDIVKSIAQKMNFEISTYTSYKDLPDDLNNSSKCHPRQIANKLEKEKGRTWKQNDILLYRKLSQVFTAKPDLLITIGNMLLVFEAKYTLEFDPDQMNLTKMIAEIWADILFMDLGYSKKPAIKVVALGKKNETKKQPIKASWEVIKDSVVKIYPANDLTRKAFEAIRTDL